MKTGKRILATILVMLMVFSAIPMSASAKSYITSATSADASNYTNIVKLQSKLNSVFSGNIGLYSNSGCTKSVTAPLGCTKMNGSNQFWVKSNTTGNTNSGWQCYIYADAVYNTLFNEWVGHGTSFSHSRKVMSGGSSSVSYSSLNSAGVKTGAIMRTTANSDGSWNASEGHSLIILSYDSSYINYLEGNGDGNGLVRIAKLTWSEFNSGQLSGRSRKVCFIVQPTDSYYNDLYPSSNTNGTSANLEISDNGISFICAREGFHEKCYSDNTQSSIGYGTKCTGSSTQPHASGLHSITKEEAKSVFLSQIKNTYSPRVRKQTVGIPMNQNQFDALVSLCFNCGGGTTLISNSPLVKFLKGELSESDAKKQYSSYIVTSGGKVLQGLINRRNLEADLFFSGYTSSDTNYDSTNPNNYTYPTRDLLYTSPVKTGSDVAWVQAVLYQLGYSIGIDGSYGPATRDTIKKFQSDNGLTVDGSCGPDTRAKLLEKFNRLNNKSYTIHGWFSDSIMGDSKESYKAGDWLYLNYSIYNSVNNKGLDSETKKSYNVKIEIYGPDNVLEHSANYTNDNNYIGIKRNKGGVYTGRIILSGDIKADLSPKATIVYDVQLSSSKSNISLNLNGTNSATSVISFSGAYPGTRFMRYSFDDDSIATADWGSWDDHSIPITVKGLKPGTTDLNISFYENYTDEKMVLKTISIPVTVTGASYTVSYNANGGTNAPSSQTKNQGIDLKLTESTPTAPTYTVSFNGNGGTVSQSSKTYSSTFMHWNPKSDDSGSWYYPGGNFNLDSSTTLYAIWSYNKLGNITATRNGYYFLGWYDSTSVDANGNPVGNKFTLNSYVTQNMTLYAMWGNSKEFVWGDGDKDGVIGFIDLTFYNNVRLGKVTPSGYQMFAGDVNADGQITYEEDVLVLNECRIGNIQVSDLPCYKLLRGMSFYSIDKSTYSYGEPFDPTGLSISIGYSNGVNYIIDEDIFVSGYDPYKIGTQTLTVRFYQWSTTMTVTVTAPSHNVSFNANGGTVSTNSKSVQYNSTYGTLPTPTRTGYTFDGWYTAINGGTKITSSSTVSSMNAETLYAHWTVNSYTVTFKNYDGTTIESDEWAYGTIPFCSSAPQKESNSTYHYEFKGWSPSVTAVGGTTTYTATFNSIAHSYNSYVVYEPTCEYTGLKRFACDCGYSYTETIAKLSHSYTAKAISSTYLKSAATCTVPATYYYKCATCSLKGTNTYTDGSAIGHNYSTNFTVDTPATCTTAGSKSKHCSRCDAKTDVTSIPATGHAYDNACDTTCNTCGATRTITHTWNSGAVTKAATCTVKGVKTYTCTVCKTTKTEDIAALGHNYSATFTVDTPATCMTDGSKSKHCSRCDAKTDVTSIPATGHAYDNACDTTCNTCGATRTITHTWNSGAVTRAATCTAKGVKTYTCTVCKTTKTEDIAALGHNYSATFTVDTPATCTTDGSKSKHCSRCDAKTEITVIPATGHVYDSGADMECNVCGYIRTCNHSFGKWAVEKASTCTEKGTQYRECSLCHSIERTSLPVKGHDFAGTFTVDTPATCTTAGSESRHCSRCNAVTDVTEIPATGHKYDNACDTTCNTCGATRTITHSWNSGAVTKEATCTAKGVKTYTCTVCKTTKTEDIAALGHSYSTSFTVDTPATCTTDGSKSKHCSRCDVKTEVTSIPATGHAYDNACDTTCNTCGATRTITHSWNSGAQTTAPTCVSKGVKTYTCTVCKTTKTEDIAALGHNYSTTFTVDTPATCTSIGIKSKHCSRCDAKTDVTSIPATGHAYDNACDKSCNNCGEIRSITHSYVSEDTTEATCTEEGLRTYTCSVCSNSYTEDIAALGHSYYSVYTIDKKATCTTAGSKSRHCSRCDAKTAVTSIPATGHVYDDGADMECNVCGYIRTCDHSYGKWTVEKASTCTVSGTQYRECSLCGNKEYDSIAALGHSYSTTFTIDTAATCTAAGSKSKHCSRCDAKTEVTLIPATGHKYDNACDTTCNTCGATRTITHSWNTGAVTKAATCTVKGVKTYTCTVCSATKTEDIAALGHNYSATFTTDTPATCSAAGSKSKHCSRCDSKSEITSIAATGHVYDNSADMECNVCGFVRSCTHSYGSWKTEKAATCTESGRRYKECSLCGSKEYEPIAALGHSYSASFITDTPATCTAAGSKSKHCSRCDDRTEITSIPATGHAYDNSCDTTCNTCGAEREVTHSYTSRVTKNATCTTNGVRTYTCSVCADSYTESIAKTGHKYQEEVTEPTCTSSGYTTYTCSVCGDSYESDEVPATGHKSVNKADSRYLKSAATCTSAAVYYKSCSVCNTRLTQTFTSGSALGHNYDEYVTAPTCTAGGYTTFICARCDDTYTGDETPAAGHSYTNKVLSKYLKTSATCTSAAVYYKSCSACGVKGTSTFTSGVPLGHDYDEEIVAPTCTQNGYTIFTCTRCDDSYTDSEIISGGHQYTNKAESKYLKSAATCTSAAVYYKSCSVCGVKGTSTFTSGSALGHDYDDTITSNVSIIPATCKADGSKTVNCSRCDSSKTETIEKIGHKPAASVKENIRNATCTSKGSYDENVYCSVCGEKLSTKKVETEKLPHSEEVIAEIKATCTSEGKTSGKKCSVCGEILITPAVTPKLQHSYSEKVTAPTCTTDGYTTYTCTVCGHSYTDDVTSKTGHREDAGTVTAEPTCITTGLKVYKCIVCKNTVRTETVPVKQHTTVVDSAIPATCTTAGKTAGSHCSFCGEVLIQQNVIKATGHSFGEWTVTDEATCAKTGGKERFCVSCGAEETEEIPMTTVHSFKTTVTKATLSNNGKSETKCQVCGKVSKTAAIAYPKTFSLSATSAVYTGKAITPTVTVKDSSGKVVDPKNYTVSYSANTNVGTAKVTITFKGNYSGTKTLNFTITSKQVTGLKASTVAKTSVKLTWTKVTGAKYYKVEQSTDGKTWKTVTTTSSTSYTVKSLKAGSKYQYRVTALDSTKKIAGKASATLKTGTLTSAPTVTLKSSKSKTAVASWKKVAGASKYIVYKSTDGKKWTKVTTTDKLTYTLTKLTGGKKVYVKVTAVNAYSKESAASTVKNVTVKK